MLDLWLLYVTQYCFRAVNRPSGPDFGRTATGKTPKSAFRLGFGRPEAAFLCFPGFSPAKIRPGRPISGPESLLPNTKWIRGLHEVSLKLSSTLEHARPKIVDFGGQHNPVRTGNPAEGVARSGGHPFEGVPTTDKPASTADV
jgi:hypothetical protein